MTEIIVVSDSHGCFQNLQRIAERHPNMEYMIHLGDGIPEFKDLSYLYPEKTFLMVQGNIDRVSSERTMRVLMCEGRKLLFTHGHEFGVKQGLEKLKVAAHAANASAVFYGHTHIAYQEWDDRMLVLNPGSCGDPLCSSYGVLQIGEEGIQATIVSLDLEQAD